MINGCLMYGDAVLIPSCLQNHVLQQFNMGNSQDLEKYCTHCTTNENGLIEGVAYLAIVDLFSKWPDIQVMRHPMTDEAVLKRTVLCNCFGIKITTVTNNGSNSQDLCLQNGICQITSPSSHLQLNGQVECFIDTF